MKFLWCTLNVLDMEKSLKFYQELVGLTLDRRFNAGPNGEFAFLGDGETKVELIANPAKKETEIGKDISLGFEVASLETMMEKAKAFGLEIDGPHQPGPMIRFFFVKDPNGARIQFVEGH